MIAVVVLAVMFVVFVCVVSYDRFMTAKIVRKLKEKQLKHQQLHGDGTVIKA